MKRISFLLILILTLKISAQNPELIVQIGHTANIQSMVISEDGKTLVSGSVDRRAKVWDIEMGKEIQTFSGHTSEIYKVALSPDKKFCISGGSDNTVRLWETETGKELKVFSALGPYIQSLSFFPDGKRILTASSDGYFRIFDIETGKEQKKIKCSSIEAAVLSRDGKKILYSEYRTIKMMDIESQNILKTYKGHGKDIQYIALSPDEKKIIAASWEYGDSNGHELKLWDVDGENIYKDLIGHTKPVRGVAFSWDGKFVLSSGLDNSIIIWEVETGNKIRTIPAETFSQAVLFTRDSRKIIAGYINSNIIIWDIASGKEVQLLKGIKTGVFSIDISANEKQFITGGSDNTVRLWDIPSCMVKKVYSGHDNSVLSVAFSPDNKKIVSGEWVKNAKVWDTETGAVLNTLATGEYSTYCVKFLPDGMRILTGNADNQIILWNLENSSPERKYTNNSSINSICVSKDGSKFVSGTGSPITTEPTEANLWSTNYGSLLKYYKAPNWVSSVEFSPDEQLVLLGCYDKTAKLWDVQSGSIVKTFQGHTERVLSASFSNDGKKIVTGSSDNKVKIWDAVTGQSLKNLEGHKGEVNTVHFFDNNRRIISSGFDCVTKIWDVESGKEIANFIAVDLNEYIVSTPDNYYTASKNAFKGVAFKSGDQIFPFEQFDLKLNRPDIVMERLGYASKNLIKSYKTAYLKRLKKMNFTEEMLSSDYHLPEIVVLTPNIPFTTDKKNLVFKVKATDSKYLLDRLNIYVNDVAVFGSNGISLRIKKTSSCEQEINLPLLNGTNKIQVSVLNNKGAESLKKTFYINQTGLAVKPELYIVTIGVSEFKDSQYNLTYAAKDAADISSFFKNCDIFSKINCISYINKDATREKIVNTKEILKKSKPDDMVIIFAATHGLLDNNMNYYLATHDIDFNNPSIKGLPYENLENLLDGIPACRKVMLIDACHSGEVDKEEMQLVDNVNAVGNVKSRGFKALKQKENMIGVQNSYDLMSELFADLRRGTGAIVISSAGGAEFALESSEWKNGVFTFSVLEGLKNGRANINNDKEITVSELRNYVFSRVKELTNGQQNPTVRQDNLEFDFRIW